MPSIATRTRVVRAAIKEIAPTEGMVLLPGGRFRMGSERFYPEEAPVREASVGPFWIDARPVTNRQFSEFVAATGYVTVAERPVDPADFPGAPAERLKAGSIVFKPSRHPIAPGGWGQWWSYKAGAHWRRPEAKSTVFIDRLNHPVTCVAYDDAEAYALWAGKSLPTEAQWEYAARGGLDGAEYAWGDDFMPDGRRMANTWPGDSFPYDPHRSRHAYRTTRVGSFPPNGYGLYDLIGNVWEWTRDWYSTAPDRPTKPGCCAAPPEDSFDPALAVRIPRRVVKGGSFLCAPSYCARYRPAARQPQMVDTASVHIGFRCVAEVADESA